MDANPQLERTVLAAVLADETGDAWATATMRIQSPLVFSERDHGVLWMLMEAVSDLGKVPHAAILADKAKTTSALSCIDDWLALAKLDAFMEPTRGMLRHQREQWKTEANYPDSALALIGGMTKLAELSAHAATAATLDGACQRLLDYYRLRKVRRTLHSLERALDAPDAVDRVNELNAHAVDALTATVDPGDAVVSLSTVDPIVVEEKPRDRGSWHDDRLNVDVPLVRKRMTVLAARPKMGKTSKACEVIRATARDADYKPGTVAVASLEVDRTELAGLLYAQALKIPAQRVERGDLDGSQQNVVRELREKWRDSIIVNDGMISTSKAICAWARAHKRRYPDFLLLVVDHLHRLQGKPGESEYEKISAATNDFTWLRKELDIHILLLCQLNRESQAGPKPRPPRLSDLRASGTIEQDCTAAVFLHCEDQEGDVRHGEYLVLANRYGPCRSLPYRFNAGHGQTFEACGREQSWKVPVKGMPNVFNVKGLEPSADEDLFA